VKPAVACGGINSAGSVMADKTDSPLRRPAGADRASIAFRSFAAYRAAYLAPDLVSGLTLAAIAIPTQMATSRLGGFSPQFGFFAFMAGSLAFAALGSSRVMSGGADSTITPIFAGGLATMAAAGSPDYIVLASVLAVLVGAILVVGGLFRFGWIAHLLSVPVTAGFLAGIAAHIFVSQLPAVLGLATPAGEPLAVLFVSAGQLGEANHYTVAIGIGVLAVILVSERIDVRIPGALIGLVAATAAVVLLGLESRGVAVLGDVSNTMPMPALPHLSRSQWAGLIPLAAIIAMVVMVQTAATTQAFPSEPDRLPDVDRDFIGVGAGSILSGLLGSFPVDASPPLTATVAQTGGRSQLAGLVAAAIVLTLVVAGAALLRHVPQAALGGVLFFVAYRIVRVRQIVTIYQTSFGEFMLIVATMAAIVVLPIEQGVGLGIALSLLHGIWSTTRARLILFERIPDTSVWWPQSPHFTGEREPDTIVVGFPAPLSFLNADDFRRGMEGALRDAGGETRLIVLEATGIVEIDFTAAQALIGLIRECRDEHIDFAVARLESIRAQEAMVRFGIDEALGPDRQFRSVEEAIRALGAADRTG
jgi:sulfate permease, SulP family